MKLTAKTGLIIFAVTALAVCAIWFCVSILPIFKMFRVFREQMLAGQKYMDSLTERDFLVWSNRTQSYLTNYNPTNSESASDGISPELAALKIVRVDKYSDSVDFLWMGGFDHTYLHVEKQTNGFFKFTAVYNDESNRVIWPKPKN